MKLADGSAADSTKVNNKPAKIIMGDGSISPAFEMQLMGLKAGDSKEFTLEESEVCDIGWFSPEEALKLNLFPEYRRTLEIYFKTI